MIYDRFRIKRKDATLILFNNVEFLHAALLYHTYNKINELQLAYGWCILLLAGWLAGCLSPTIICPIEPTVCQSICQDPSARESVPYIL